MSNKLSLRVGFCSLALFVFAALAGSTVATQAQCGQQRTKPTNTGAQSSGSATSNTGATKPQSDMSNMDMSKMDMGNEKAGNMDMSSCPCPYRKSGACAGGTCSLKDHVATRTSKSSTVTTKRRSSQAQPKKKTP